MAFERIEQTVVADLPPGAAGSRPGAPGRWVKADRKEEAAHKLRARGLSYRRIAEELQVRYDVISRWLSGVGEPAGRRTADPPRPWSPPRFDAVPVREDQRDAVRELLARCDALETRASDLLATIRQVSAENREREDRLRRTLEDERRAAAEREERLRGELDQVRGLVEDLLARIAAAAPDGAAGDGGDAVEPVARSLWGRLGLWRRIDR